MACENRSPEEIFDKAIEIADPAARAVFLEDVCQGDKKLRAEVESLLSAHEQAGDFLQEPGSGACVTLDGSPQIDGPGTTIGRYELLELIGEGGMGLVYLAEQKEPVRRKVAFKIVKPGMDSKQVIARFEAERQALALLDHPNIAHVYDAGCTETGRPYFVMEHVKGMSITRYCDEHKLPIEQRLRLFEQVCEGDQHAHQKGIIHRDLKPSNILVTMQGDRPVPKIIDFGIAKATTQTLTDATMFTCQGQFLGTPEYMSPEQADLATQDIDTRSDIYSLGVVLYELLAGVLPFESESFTKIGLAEIQRTIREVEPASPSLRLTQMGEKAKGIAESRGTQVVPLARCLHRELEWIPLKAMRKDRCRRYKSASDMADDIRNYLNGNPLIAGPETAMYRVQKFVRKHAGSVATVVLVAVAVVLGLVVSTAMYFRSERALQRETVARTEAEDAREKESIARTRAERAEESTRAKAEELRHTLYVNSIQLADAKHREGETRRARELLSGCPEDMRGWEWERLSYILDESAMTIAAGQDGITSLALSPDGRRIVSGGWDKTIKIWDVATGSELVTINPGDKNEYHQAIARGDLDRLQQTRLGLVFSVAFSPDGKQIASGHYSGEINTWDAVTGEKLATIKGHQRPVYSIAFSPDGTHMASRAYEVKLWDTTDWTELMSLSDPETDKSSLTGNMSFVTFSPDGKRIASAGGLDGQIKIWDITTGQKMSPASRHDRWAHSVSFSPDGRFLASGGDNHVRIWDGGTGSHVMTLRGHEAPTFSVSFSPDGKSVVSGGYDGLIKVWDAASGETVMTLHGHEGTVDRVVFTPDGKHLVSGSWDGTIKIWDVAVTRTCTRLIGHHGRVGSMAFSPDGKRIVSAGVDGLIKLWDVESATELKTLHTARGIWLPASSVAFSPDGKRIVSGGFSGTFTTWDAATGNPTTAFRGPKPHVTAIAMAISPDGKHLATSGGVDKTVRIWDMARGEEVMTLKGHDSLVHCAAFSPDGRLLASGAGDPNIKIWEWATGRESMTLRGHEGGIITSVVFSPDGMHIVSTSQQDAAARLWSVVTGTMLRTFRHADGVTSAAFSPDGKRIITGSHDRTVRVWDAATGAELLTLRAGFVVDAVTFSPDGKTIAGGPFDDTISFWESAPPARGYELRKNGEAARQIVDELHEKHGLYHEVITQLQHDTALDLVVRKLGIQIADSRKWEDGENLRKEAWRIVSLSDQHADRYQTALAKAEQARDWEPNDPAILTMVGATQYRLGSYEDALKTLAEAARMSSDAKEGSDPVNSAFTAMVLHAIGRADEAKNALLQVRDLAKERPFVEDIELQALLREVEKLIEGKKS
jgi:WD40 repeat protein